MFRGGEKMINRKGLAITSIVFLIAVTFSVSIVFYDTEETDGAVNDTFSSNNLASDFE